MPITYTVTLNTNEDDSPLDLTADVRAMTWRLGSETAKQALAPPGRARLTVYRPDGFYGSGAASVAGRWLTIRSHDGVTERLHFSGPVDSVTPGTAFEEPGVAVLEAVTADAGLASLTAMLPPLSGASAGELLSALLADLPLRRPSLGAVWVLEEPDFGVLGTSARLAGSLPLPIEADEGISRFAFAALGGLPVSEALRQIVASEGGRCAASRDGALVFRDRHRPLRTGAFAAEFNDTMVGVQLDCGGGWANRVRVPFTPVRLGPPDSVLWQLDTPQRLPPGVRRSTVGFRDATGKYLAAWTVDRLIASATDGNGAPGLIEALIVSVSAREAVIEWRNPGAGDVWLDAGTRLEGTPLEQDAPLVAEQTDMRSMAFHGPRLRAIDAPLIDSLDEADSRARFELLRAPAPALHAHSVELDVRAVPGALGLMAGDRIQITHTRTGHSAAYGVIGEAHTVDAGGARHRIRLILDPAPLTRFWELDTCALGPDTALAH